MTKECNHCKKNSEPLKQGDGKSYCAYCHFCYGVHQTHKTIKLDSCTRELEGDD